MLQKLHQTPQILAFAKSASISTVVTPIVVAARLATMVREKRTVGVMFVIVVYAMEEESACGASMATG